MMEVEDHHGYYDADMLPEEVSVDYDDHDMQDDHQHVAIPEVEMGNDVVEEDIEYDMEDASENILNAEDVVVPLVSVDTPVIADSPSRRTRTPPPADSLKPDVVFESPSQARTPEPTASVDEVQAAHPEASSAVLTTATPGEPEVEQAPVATQEDAETPKIAENAESSGPGDIVVATEPEERQERTDESPDEPSAPRDDDPLPTEETTEDALANEEEPTNEEAVAEYFPSSVLISSSSTSHPVFYLFATPENSPDELVYMADQPQLFYEPLQAVFETIRGLADELSIPEHVELAFYSEALDLNVSEVHYFFVIPLVYETDQVIYQDNVYCREVSLNDLNILHIGCELEGPLSLRLDQNSPRFILRYRAIMAELHRVSSGNEGGTGSVGMLVTLMLPTSRSLTNPFRPWPQYCPRFSDPS